MKYLLGLDIGSSSVKAAVVEAESGKTLASAQSPAEEMAMQAPQPGWAEQDPMLWWEHVGKSIRKCLNQPGVNPKEIAAIGISYQMHGLVCVGKDGRPLRPSIIWCDSRAVSIGQDAFRKLGEKYCLEHLLNSPGNFTASKLKWVRDNDPKVYSAIHKVMLPGDFIAMKLTGETNTTASGLSEGTFWDYLKGQVADELLKFYGIDPDLLPTIVPTFSVQGSVQKAAADELGLPAGIPVSYRAGDQPNNALSLNVLNPGETAATAGTSGVIYSVTDKPVFDVKSRVNTFIHVNNNHSGKKDARNGVLLCINGTGILNSWMRKSSTSNGTSYKYDEMNRIAASAPIGCDGLVVLPFGNGAERILENKDIGGTVEGLNFNRHGQSHLFRAAQEGIVYSLAYGFDILKNMGVSTSVIRAGRSNMFLSPLFREAFVNSIGATLELYDTDGAKGAALGAGVGSGIFSDFKEAFAGLQKLHEEAPSKEKSEKYRKAYDNWLKQLNDKL
jgi:xylulokinase